MACQQPRGSRGVVLGALLAAVVIWAFSAGLVLTQRRPARPGDPVRNHVSSPTVLLAGRLLDPAAGTTTVNMYIVVDSGHVVAVGPKPTSPEAEVIDLSGYTVLPGLIDAHVHLTIGGTVRDNALATLRAGFTTVVDLGARTLDLLALRDSINAGLIPGPRVLAAGQWIGTANGVCEFKGLGVRGGADAFERRVRDNLDAGANVIKVCVSGWPAEAHRNQDRYEVTWDALATVVRTAHEAKRLVIAHDISPAGVEAGRRAGIDGLAHAAYLDWALAARLEESGIFLVPTLASLTQSDTSAVARDLFSATGVAWRAGVSIVFGTDGGVLPHGKNAAEFDALRAAGISSLDAVRSATSVSARALRIDDSVGAIRPGMVADLIAIEGDPLQDLAALRRVRFVMARGRVVRR